MTRGRYDHKYHPDDDPRRITGLQHTLRRARAIAKETAKKTSFGRDDLFDDKPKVEQVGGKVYLRLPAGQRWRVYDVRVRPNGTLERLPLMHRDATTRAFVVEDATVTKLYTFKEREGRGMSAAHLADQLSAAEVRG